MAYSKRYAAGFVDKPTLTTPIDSTFLNAVEAALLKLFDTDPSADAQVLQWINASSKFGPALILNKNVDAAAAIAKSKLDFTGGNGIVNADIAGAAAIAKSKLAALNIVNADVDAAAAIALSKLAGYPTDATKFARGDGTWAVPSTVYRKTSANAVTNTVTDTDLLNGEFQVGAGVLSTNKVARLTAWGDWIQNSGAVSGMPRFKLKLGATPTVAVDTSAGSGSHAKNTASRWGWRIVAEIQNLGATNSQWVNIKAEIVYVQNAVALLSPFTTGEGSYYGQSIVGADATTPTIAFAQGGNSATIDTTAAMNVLLTVVNPTATATCETKLYGAILEIV